MLYTPLGLHGSTTLIATGIGAILGGPVAPIVIAVGLGFTVFELRAAASAAKSEARRHVADVLPHGSATFGKCLEDEAWQTFNMISQRFEESLQLQVRTLETAIDRLNERLAAGDGVDEVGAEALRQAHLEADSVVHEVNARLSEG